MGSVLAIFFYYPIQDQSDYFEITSISPYNHHRTTLIPLWNNPELRKGHTLRLSWRHPETTARSTRNYSEITPGSSQDHLETPSDQTSSTP